jgi:hypothetical protein
MEEASMTDHSAVRVMLGVRNLERLLREEYENHQKSETLLRLIAAKRVRLFAG